MYGLNKHWRPICYRPSRSEGKLKYPAKGCEQFGRVGQDVAVQKLGQHLRHASEVFHAPRVCLPIQIKSIPKVFL